MLLRKLNTYLYLLEDMYADTIISLKEFNKGKSKILSLIKHDNDLCYDDEINQIYRVSDAKKRLHKK